MTRGEYDKIRRDLISARRSLIMSVRQSGHKSKTYQAELQTKLDDLPETPPRLPEVYGFEMIDTEGTYAGFTFDKTEALELAEIHNLTIKRRITNRPTSDMLV